MGTSKLSTFSIFARLFRKEMAGWIEKQAYDNKSAARSPWNFSTIKPLGKFGDKLLRVLNTLVSKLENKSFSSNSLPNSFTTERVRTTVLCIEVP